MLFDEFLDHGDHKQLYDASSHTLIKIPIQRHQLLLYIYTSYIIHAKFLAYLLTRFDELLWVNCFNELGI